MKKPSENKGRPGPTTPTLLYITGKRIPGPEGWALIGIFETLPEAEAARRTSLHFVGAVPLGVDSGDRVDTFPGMYGGPGGFPHPFTCPKCGKAEAKPLIGGSGNLHCVYCGNVWPAPDWATPSKSIEYATGMTIGEILDGDPPTVVCPGCDGDGVYKQRERDQGGVLFVTKTVEPCPTCDGKGRIPAPRPDRPSLGGFVDDDPHSGPCPDCKGAGKVPQSLGPHVRGFRVVDCQTCGGSGRVFKRGPA